jgi:hypothetical protein
MPVMIRQVTDAFPIVVRLLLRLQRSYVNTTLSTILHCFDCTKSPFRSDTRSNLSWSMAVLMVDRGEVVSSMLAS